MIQFSFFFSFQVALALTLPSAESFFFHAQFKGSSYVASRSTFVGKNRYIQKAMRMHIEESQSSSYDTQFSDMDVSDEVEASVEVDQPAEVKTLTPYEEAVSKYKNQLEKELEYIESVLKCERNLLMLRKDTISVSGKNGYYFVQVEVAEFQKRKEIEQKNRVTKNKREFVEKMLPVVDAFRAAPTLAPSSNDREESMHVNFGSLCKSILVVFEKYGFKEFDAEIGNPVSLSHHEVSEFVDGEVGGVVVTQSRPGLVDKDGEVLRRSLVTATKGQYKAPEAVVEVAVVEVADESDIDIEDDDDEEEV